MKIKLLATSDVHGYITPYRYSDQKMANLGMMKLAPYLRKKDKYTVLIDNGDVLEGSPLNYYHELYHREDTHPMAKIFNALDYDYVNIGNHEFNYGKEMTFRYLNDLNAKCITRNIKHEGKRIGCDYQIHRFDENHAIALIGLTTQYIPNWEKPHHITNMEFEHVLESVKEAVTEIKAKETVNGIVVVYHGGFECDVKTGEYLVVDTGENLGYRICKEVEGIDVMISGHQHQSLQTTCVNTVVTQTAFNAQELAEVEWDLDTHEIQCRLIPAGEEVDWSLLPLIEEEEKETQAFLDRPLGKFAQGDLLIRDAFDAKVHKHPLISFLNQVQLAVSGADCSACALFNDAVGFRQTITMRDCISTYVYPNTLVVLEITGRILKEFLEKCAEYFDVKDGEICISYSYEYPKPQHYNYDMVDGVSYTIHCANPIGERVTDLMFKGKALEADQTLTMVVNNYRAACGGDFFMLENAKIVDEIQTDMVTCLADYILAHPEVEVHHEENIKVVL